MLLFFFGEGKKKSLKEQQHGGTPGIDQTGPSDSELTAFFWEKKEKGVKKTVSSSHIFIFGMISGDEKESKNTKKMKNQIKSIQKKYEIGLRKKNKLDRICEKSEVSGNLWFYPTSIGSKIRKLQK